MWEKKLKKHKQQLKLIKFQNFTKFKSIISKNIDKKNFAIAISGGADSLCLAYFSKIYSSEFKNKIHALIVDHRLRKESSKEATNVQNLLKKRKIPSKILSWKGKVPSKNIQKNARDIRYSLISNYLCSALLTIL